MRQPLSEWTRDASIQRFEFTFELAWKTAAIDFRATKRAELVRSSLAPTAAVLVAGLTFEQRDAVASNAIADQCAGAIEWHHIDAIGFNAVGEVRSDGESADRAGRGVPARSLPWRGAMVDRWRHYSVSGIIGA